MTDEQTRTDLVAQLAKVQERIAVLHEQEATLKESILRTCKAGPDTYAAGELAVIVSASRRLDADAIAARYPVAQNPHLYKAVIDTAAIRQHLSPVQLADLTTVGALSVKLK